MTRAGALLGVIDADMLPSLEGRGPRRAFAAGSVLMRQGGPPDAMFLILQGRVRVERSVPTLARPLHVADVGAGDVVGEIGILNGTVRSATVRAITDVITIELSRQATLEALLEVPGLPVVLQRLARKRLAEIDDLTDRLTRYVQREAVAAGS